jgi:accessory gene regulator B
MEAFMIDKIVDKNIIFLQRHGVKMDSDDNRAIYKYGLQIIYYYIIDLAVILSLAAIFGRLYETVIMTAIFGLLQVFGGGYHAKTPLKCLLTMVVGVAAGNILITLIAEKLVFNMILAAILSGIMLILTPVTNKKHPVGKKIKQRSKIMIRIIVILIFFAALILSHFNKNAEVAIITVILALYLTSLIAAKKRT